MAGVHKAGAIVMSEKEPSKIALLYRSKQNDWTFPKGHVEEGESALETTVREIAEETGLPVSDAGGELPPLKYDHPNGNRVVMHMFLLRSDDDSRLKPEFNGDRVVWVEVDEVASRLSYDNLSDYFLSILDRVKRAVDVA